VLSVGVSHVRRLRLSDRIFFLSVNLSPKVRHFSEAEFALLIDVSLGTGIKGANFIRLNGARFLRSSWAETR
jgi:hypothetical protein